MAIITGNLNIRNLMDPGSSDTPDGNDMSTGHDGGDSGGSSTSK